MNIHEKFLNILDELNIITEDEGEIIDIESVAFISLIVRIEETFDIVFPDDLLDITKVQSISNLEIIVNNLLDAAQ